MKKIIFVILIIVLITNFVFLQNKKEAYFGQKKPGMIPEIFAPGIISTKLHNHSSVAFSGDLNEVFFSVANSSPHVILTKKKVGGQWSKTEVASFSGQYYDDDPFFSPDDNRLYFSSLRPDAGTGKPKKKDDIWFVERIGNGWSVPQRLPRTINLPDSSEIYPSLARNGNLYFNSDRKGGQGSVDIYMSKWENGKFIKAKNLGPLVNSEFQEAWSCISPDESYILFNYWTRGKGEDGFAISLRDKTGIFGTPFIIKELDGSARMPIFSPNGKYLFFNLQGFGIENPSYSKVKVNYASMKRKLSSWKNGKGNVVWMSTDFFNKFKIRRSKK